MLLTYATRLGASTMEAMPRGPKAKRSARSPKLKLTILYLPLMTLETVHDLFPYPPRPAS
jgi:hypothetical protein